MSESNKSPLLKFFFRKYFYTAALSASFLITLLLQDFLAPLGWTIHDWLQRKFPEEKKSQVAVISVDNASLKALAEQDIYFPFPREIWSELLAVAKSHNAALVGFDIILSENSIRGPSDDNVLAEALREVKFPIVFPTSHDASIPAPLEIFQTPSVKLGNVNFAPMIDGIYRQQPASSKNNSLSDSPHGTKSFPFVVASSYLKKNPTAIRELIHFSKNIEQIPLFNVLQERTQSSASPQLLRQLENKIWLIGYSASGLFDLKSSPVDTKSNGTMILANAIHNLIQENSGIALLKSSHWAALLICLLFLSAISLKHSPTQTPMGLGGQIAFLILVIPVAASVIFWKQHIWVNPFPIVLGLTLLGVFVMLQRIFIEWRERLQFSKVVEHSMSSEMTSLIKEGKFKTDRFGEKKNITILFADLAGFTTLSEKLKPEELVEVINVYLDDVVDLIFHNKGYIDKFIGDAVMALWGAPVDDPQHAENALRAALSFEDLTQKFQSKIKEKYKFDFEINLITRVGIHTGVAVVGNLGARKRFNYTALGDSVNLASRLEGIGKQYQQLLTISGDVVQNLMNSSTANPILNELLVVDEIVVKGKTLPTKIYTACKDPSIRSRYTQAYELYQKGGFQEALSLISEDSPFGPENVLRARCQRLLLDPKLPQFKNGIWHHDEK